MVGIASHSKVIYWKKQAPSVNLIQEGLSWSFDQS